MNRLKFVSKVIGRKLTAPEIDIVSNNNIDDLFNGFVEEKKEKKEVAINAVLGLEKLQNIFPSVKTIKIILQRRNSVDPDPETNQFSWKLATIAGDGVIQLDRPIGNILSMRMLDFKSQFDWDYYDSPRNQFTHNAHTYMTFLIEELSSQSFNNSFGGNFHFMGQQIRGADFHRSSNGSRVVLFSQLEPLEDNLRNGSRNQLIGSYFNDGLFEFRKPISSLDSITLSAYAGNKPYYFPQMGFSAIQSPDSTPSLYINFLYHQPDRLSRISTGDATQRYRKVVISGFTTSDPITDKELIDFVNREEGFIYSINSNPSLPEVIIEDGLDTIYVYNFSGAVDFSNVKLHYYFLDFYIPLEITYYE